MEGTEVYEPLLPEKAKSWKIMKYLPIFPYKEDKKESRYQLDRRPSCLDTDNWERRRSSVRRQSVGASLYLWIHCQKLFPKWNAVLPFYKTAGQGRALALRITFDIRVLIISVNLKFDRWFTCWYITLSQNDRARIRIHKELFMNQQNETKMEPSYNVSVSKMLYIGCTACVLLSGIVWDI